MLAMSPQNNAGCLEMISGPGVIPCTIMAPIISAISALGGMPRLNIGMKDAWAAAEAAPSNIALPARDKPLGASQRLKEFASIDPTHVADERPMACQQGRNSQAAGAGAGLDDADLRFSRYQYRCAKSRREGGDGQASGACRRQTAEVRSSANASSAVTRTLADCLELPLSLRRSMKAPQAPETFCVSLLGICHM